MQCECMPHDPWKDPALVSQVVHATNHSSGNDTTLVLGLSEPVYNASAKTLTFTVAPKAADARPKLTGGAAEGALATPGSVQMPAAGLVLTVRQHAHHTPYYKLRYPNPPRAPCTLAGERCV